MAHRRRAQFVDELLPQLPGTKVTWDRENDRWDTGRRSMLAFDPDADWHLVVQDDAVLCPDFLPAVEAALSHVPERPVSFYTGRVRPYAASIKTAVTRARAAGKPWLAMRGPHWGVAVAIPTHLIEDMIEWCDQQVGVPNYDRRMEKYFTRREILCWHSIPSLVDHRVGEENPSLIPGRGAAPSRTAHEWIGNISPLDIDWSRGALLAPDCPAPGASRASGPLEKKGPKMPRYAIRDIYTGSGNYRSLVARAGQQVPPGLVHLVDETDMSSTLVAASSAGHTEVSISGDASGLPRGVEVDYAALKVPQLRKLCKERDIEIPLRAKKAGLIDLLAGAPA